MFSTACHLLKRNCLAESFQKLQSGIFVSIRWRKRRDRPRAKSKFFIVRQPTIEDSGERAELVPRMHHYNTEMKAITKLFKDQFLSRGVSAGTMSGVEAKDLEDQEHKRFMVVNKEWNENVAREREIRIAKELLDAEARTIGSIERADREQFEDLMVKEEEVRRLKERGKDFVTLKNLDAKIEELLDSKVNYNFAIDLEGNKVHDETRELFQLNSDELSSKIKEFKLKL